MVAKLPAGGLAVELPGDLDKLAVHSPVPGFRLLAQSLEIGDSSITEALPGEELDFDLRLIEPTSVVGV